MKENNHSPRTPAAAVPLPDPNDWEAIRRWRVACRTLLIKERLSIGKAGRQQCQQDISASLMEMLAGMGPGCIGFYWPIKGEFDLRGLVAELIDLGWSAALPVIEEPGTPLKFCQWHPDTKLVPGVWNIPVPQQRIGVAPSVLLVPLVGFDSANFRLGHGGGYYDRTLASLENRPLAIGVGLEGCRLDTIYPQRHDIAMDRIVTAHA